MGCSEPIWSVKVSVDDIPEAGAHIDLSADEATRAMVARAAGLRDLPRFEASFDVRRHGGGLHVSGEVSAKVGQNCVVTLEPIENEISEGVDLVFAPDTDQSMGDARGEATMRFSEAEPAEPLAGGSIDLGAVATEFLLLGIDPYPRREDAVFEAPPAGDPASHPFAALAALKKPKNEGD